jgi:hypothetical protein
LIVGCKSPDELFKFPAELFGPNELSSEPFLCLANPLRESPGPAGLDFGKLSKVRSYSIDTAKQSAHFPIEPERSRFALARKVGLLDPSCANL